MAILSTLRSAVRRRLVRLRDAIDGWLHPRRRRRARQRLRDARPETILFICLGNICRSPYAEHVFRARNGGAVRAVSAGFILPGRQPPESALEMAASRNVDTEDHRSQVVSDALLDDADVVFIFDRFNARRLRKVASVPGDRVLWLGDLDPEWVGKRAIIDPWGKPVEEFDRTFERIERCVDEVIEVISGAGRVPTTDGTP